MQDDLLFLYQQLRRHLDAAYAAPRWNTDLVDRIAQDMLLVERSLDAEGGMPETFRVATTTGDAHASQPERQRAQCPTLR